MSKQASKQHLMEFEGDPSGQDSNIIQLSWCDTTNPVVNLEERGREEIEERKRKERRKEKTGEVRRINVRK